MGEWQANFAASTTGIAFALTLSANQATLLHFIDMGAHHDWSSASGRNFMVPTVRGLISRGLVEHNSKCQDVKAAGGWAKIKWIYRPTPAGKIVLELLRMASVVPATEKRKTAA
jgi:hypothetical protein